MMDYMARNILHSVNPDIQLISASTTLKETKLEKVVMSAVLNIIGFAIYPVSLGLGLPVFMHSLVLEKECRLKSIMKMHGLKEINYWVMNWLMNISIYSVSASVYYFFASRVFQLEAFSDSGSDILVS